MREGGGDRVALVSVELGGKRGERDRLAGVGVAAGAEQVGKPTLLPPVPVEVEQGAVQPEGTALVVGAGHRGRGGDRREPRRRLGPRQRSDVDVHLAVDLREEFGRGRGQVETDRSQAQLAHRERESELDGGGGLAGEVADAPREVEVDQAQHGGLAEGGENAGGGDGAFTHDGLPAARTPRR